MTTTEPTLDTVDHEAEGDFHVYVLRGPNGTPHRIASCDDDSLAFALVTLHLEEQITDDMRVGILHRPDGAPVGAWLVNPWANGSPKPKKEDR